MQLCRDEAPLLLIVPAGQEVHAEAPTRLYVPAGHMVHCMVAAAPLAPKYPATHWALQGSMVVVKTELATAAGHSVDMHPEPNFFHRGALHVKSHPVAV
jgi:hypothetical protein